MKGTASKGRRSLGRTLVFAAFFLLALAAGLFWRIWPELHRPTRIEPAFQIVPALFLASLPTAARFDFPIGSENGALAYNAQPFTQNHHLGDDLNGIGGENSDLGDPVYAVADGRVLFADEGGPGWGNIVIVLHAYEENGARKYLQSYYAHLDEILVQPKQTVRRGEQIATVGTANGRYWAHLHFEMREFTTPFIGPGYREDTRGWIDPSAFIARHRGAPEDDVGRGTPADAR
jgi:murein DD-endopeptidase MepM/ murein hydrolase activator NlpD